MPPTDPHEAAHIAISDQLDAIADDLRLVLDALTGNGLGASVGLIERTRNLETDLKDVSEAFNQYRRDQAARWDKIRWTAFGIGIGGGLSSGGLVWAIAQFFS